MTLALIQDNIVIEYRDDSALNTDQSKLHPAKPRLVPVVEVNATYDPVSQVRSEALVTVEATRVLWTYTVRAKNTDEINRMRQNKLNAVHQEATKRLTPVSGAAASQQIEALTKLMQLLYKYGDRTAWSQADKDTVQTCVNRIQATTGMRGKEDAKVSELQALNDPTAINNYDTAAGW